MNARGRGLGFLLDRGVDAVVPFEFADPFSEPPEEEEMEGRVGGCECWYSITFGSKLVILSLRFLLPNFWQFPGRGSLETLRYQSGCRRP